MKNTERLQKYQFENYTYVTNFERFEDAEEYAAENAGEIVEVGFTDGADNPEMNSDGHLMATRNTFRVGLDPEYEVLYSDDPRFQEMAEDILENMKEKENDVLPEDWISDQNIASGDRIIIIKNGEVNTVTTRERIKFLMRGNVYEIAVKIANSQTEKL
ncbi:hypothetical protein IV494_00845 [Kaistella sp. G5-32]|uniref:Uncharacterized protein n=1 Tax=Kaistella gelatinilytica TaxID=2787636 RepID=A0ABS0F7M4_9FLAO|nr:hypothetical protein [Kaistella gelatinilytica]MBF8455714.1 hypothetical protein [Kaistella gelatinilytica]